ncbi:MAG TPA: flagellar export chaperone FliS [Bacillota bacterium]|nr:flagellar export chaperone FliS [Bacillota bacterium]
MGVSAYRTAKINTLPRELWPAAAYAGVLSLIGRAERAIARGDPQDAHNALVMAQHVVLALKACLQPEAGELSVHLASLYDYIAGQLGQANVAKDAVRLQSLVQVIAPLRDAWENAGRQLLQGLPATGER